MRSRLNLATSPFVSYRGFILTAALLAAAALVCTLFIGMKAVAAWRVGAATRARLGELEQRRRDLAARQESLETDLQEPGTREALDRAQFFNQLIERKRLSSIRLFQDLEASLPADVRVLSVAPRLREDGQLQVELRVGGRSAASVIEFLRALEEGQAFREVALHSQSHESAGHDAFVANITAVYVRE